jgi:hypothetical protein
VSCSFTAEVRAAVAEYIADDAHLLAFVGNFVTESNSHTMGDKVGRNYLKLDRKSLARS